MLASLLAGNTVQGQLLSSGTAYLTCTSDVYQSTDDASKIDPRQYGIDTDIACEIYPSRLR